MKNRKIIVAVTGASGSVYARLLVDELLRQNDIETISLIFSRNGKAVTEYEEQFPFPEDDRIKIFDHDDMFAPPASGSAGYDAMIVVPCSMGTLGRIANGISDDLISRAADVILKERKQVIMVVRESPYNTIHLDNMAGLSRAGALILPASPSFYSKPESIEELCMTVVERIMSHLGFRGDYYEWGIS